MSAETDARVLAQLAAAEGPVLLPAVTAALAPLTPAEGRRCLARLTRAGLVRTFPPPPGCPRRWGERYEATAAGRARALGAQLALDGMPARPCVVVQPSLLDPPDYQRSAWDVAADHA